jgi:tetratricopeptide (TPR) repeat protein
MAVPGFARNIKSNWNNPEQLSGIIVDALKNGFRTEVVAAAERLYQTDPQPDRGSCVWSIVLREEGRLAEAETVLTDFMARHGENGVILTNLAKVYSSRQNVAKADDVLWRALEVDPNQENGVGWYLATHRERGGEPAYWEALRRVAALPGSWRAQLWLARQQLESNNLEQALSYYRQILATVGNPVPSDLLMQMSGDLGNSGHLPELLQLTEPGYVPQIHGLQVGNNLIKAQLDLGQVDAARKILNDLYSLKRPDWQQTLSFWDTEIARTRLTTRDVDQTRPLKMVILTGQGPVWLHPSSPATELFPAKISEGPTIGFLSGTVVYPTNSKRVVHQLPDAAGRLSRSLPLFFAEQAHFYGDARVQTLIPWIAEEAGGFVVSGKPWSDEDAANYARQDQVKNDYVVATHLNTETEPWMAELRLLRAIDGTCLGQINAAFPSNRPQVAVPQLARQLTSLLAKQAEAKLLPAAPLYEVPAEANFPYYLLRLEQLLAVRCSGINTVQASPLSGVHEIIDGNIQQCLACAKSVPARLLLTQTLTAMKKVHPEILRDFRDKLALLQKEKPLSEPAQAVVQRLLDEVLGEAGNSR